MKTFPAELIDQIAAGQAIVKSCVELQFGSPYWRFTDADIDIYLAGNGFSPNGMQLTRYEETGASAPVGAAIIVPDAVGAVSSPLMANDYRGDTVIMYWAALQTWGGVIASDEFFRGEFDDFHLAGDMAELMLSSEMVKWMDPHMIKSAATCHWPFKGPRCGYSGPNTYCDHTWSLCDAYGNTDNFGGSRWLPVVSEQELPWGRPY